MNSMRKLLIAGAAVLSFASAQAQFSTDYLKAADDYFRRGDYYSAAQYYEKYLGTKRGGKGQSGYNPYVVQTAARKGNATRTSSREEAVYNTAESYRLLNYHVKAEPFYKEAVEFDAAQFPLARYHYATTLRALEQYQEAEAAFTAFLSSYKEQDQYMTAAQREVKNLQFIQQQLKRKDFATFKLQKGAAGLNDTGATYAPVWMNSNTLLFTSTRPADSSKKKGFTNRLYTANVNNGAVEGIAALPVNQNDMHQGVASVTPDGKTLFITRWSVSGKKRSAMILSSSKTASGWSEPAPVGGLNQDDASSQQPFVMPDGRKLMFSSNRTGGQGGFDLYMADLLSDGSVTNITNLGPSINTSFDEQAPYYHAPSSTLVFSTNGRVGMGEFDLFFTKGTPGSWSEPQNFGHPINSVKDDIYFASKGGPKNILEDVMLSSDRASACCLELFSLQKPRALRRISGTVLSCDNQTPIAGAAVAIVDTINNRTVATLTTDASGRYSFTLEDFQPLKAVANVKDFYTNYLHFNAPANAEDESLSNPALCLNAIKVDEPVVVENVLYDFARWELKPESFTELNKLVETMTANPDLKAEISAHTDAVGSDRDNMKLSERRAQSVVEYLVSKGISRDRLIVKGYGETKPLAPNSNPDGTDNPEGREKNRRTEFKVLKN